MGFPLSRLAVALAAASLPCTLPAAPAQAHRTSLESNRPRVSVPQEYICWETKASKDPNGVRDRPSCSVPVTLSGPTRDTVVVVYRTESVTAKPDADYVEVDKGELVIRPRETAGHLHLVIIPDCEREREEQFTLELLDASGAELGEERRTTVTIVDDDDPDC
jgi:hypothetical protein